MDMRKIVVGVFVSIGMLGLVGCGSEGSRTDVERVSDVEIRTVPVEVTATPAPVTATETVTPKPVKVTETVRPTATETATVTATPAPKTVTATATPATVTATETVSAAPATVTATATETVRATVTATPEPVRVTATVTAEPTPAPVRTETEAKAKSVKTEAKSAPVVQKESVWDRLAECESGGDWSINTGNNYFGGVQFAKTSWDAMGGQEFAAYPHQASKEEQIIVAERVLEVQGWKAWPACSAELGLR